MLYSQWMRKTFLKSDILDSECFIMVLKTYKTLKLTQEENKMEIVGIDVGFGFTKAYNGKNSILFKSIIGDATDIQFNSSLGDDSSASNLHILLEDNGYFIGSYAEQQSNIREFTLDQGKLIEDFIKILAVTATGLCTDSTAPVNVVTGLPVRFLKKYGKKLTERIKGKHKITFHNQNGQDIIKKIHIDQIHVIPQPIGSIFNLIFDEHGKIKDQTLAKQKLGVIDIGFKTTDFSILDHLRYVERGSSTINNGIAKCFAAIAAKLRLESNINIELYRMFKFNESGTIKIRGKEYNIANLKKRIFQNAASAIATDINRMWENDWDIDSIILSGGGSVDLSEYIVPNIEGNVIPIKKDTDLRLNNVKGYCKFGRYKWGYSKHIAEKQEIKQELKNRENQEEQASDKNGKNKNSSKGISWLRH